MTDPPSIQITMIGVGFSHPPDFVIDRPQGLGQWLFLHFHSPVRMLQRGEEALLEPGSCFIYAPDEPQWYTGADTGLANDYLHVAGAGVSACVAEFALPVNCAFAPLRTGVVEQLLASMRAEFSARESGWELALALQFRLLCLLLRRELDATARSAPSAARPRAFDRLREVRRLMLDQHAAPWTLHALAERASMSRSRFAALYRDFFGSTPNQDLIAARLRHACHLLSGTNCSISDVAEACGFGTPQYFCRVFRKSVGTPPGRYRDAN